MKRVRCKCSRRTPFLFFAVYLFLLTAGILTWTASSVAAEYHGEGYVDYKVFSPTTNQADSPVFKQRWNFIFQVSNDLWRIHLEDASVFYKKDYSFDGTNTYAVIPLRTNMIAQIFPTEYPPPTGDPAMLVWFTYCSGSYMRRATNNLLCSLNVEAQPAVAAYGLPVRSELDFLDGDLHLPRRCLQFSDGAIYDKIDVTKRPPVVLGYKYGGVFSNGFTKVTYNVSETTNASGLTFAKAFRLQLFRPKGGGATSNDVFALGDFNGCLQSVELGAPNFGNGVQVQPKAFVDDYRGMKLDPPVEIAQYFNPSNSWLPFVPGSIPYTIYENSKLMQSRMVAQSRSKKAIVAVLFVLSTIPIIVIGVRRLLFQTKSPSVRS